MQVPADVFADTLAVIATVLALLAAVIYLLWTRRRHFSAHGGESADSADSAADGAAPAAADRPALELIATSCRSVELAASDGSTRAVSARVVAAAGTLRDCGSSSSDAHRAFPVPAPAPTLALFCEIAEAMHADEPSAASRLSRLSTAELVSVLRLAIFVDVQNIYYTVKQSHGCHFDYKTFWDQVTAGRKVVRAFAYAIDRRDRNQMEFQKILQSIGFEVKLKPFIKRSDGSRGKQQRNM